MPVCPVMFEPILKPKIWGGRRLGQLLGRTLPTGQSIGEVWEVADLEHDQSVARAPAEVKGATLQQLVRQWGPSLVRQADLIDRRFPLLVKYLDAREALSVQVHPRPGAAGCPDGPAQVKNEAWYVLHAEPNGAIYRGLLPGADGQALVEALRTGRVPDVLRRIPVRPGECFYLPGGTVHALGAGIAVAEVQTPSDVTYRLYDWDRVDAATGQARPLHIEQALQCISFEPREYPEERRAHRASVWTTMTRLVTCESFVIELVRMSAGLEQTIPYGELVVWMVLSGSGHLGYTHSANGLDFRGGDTLVLPAGLEQILLATREDCAWLEVTLPKHSRKPS